MASEPNFYAYAMESPHLSVKRQLDSCSMWTLHHFSKRRPKPFWDKRTEYKEKLFCRNQGKFLGIAVQRGDMIVLHSPEVVFNSYEDYLQTARVCKSLGIKIGFVENRFNLEHEGGLAGLKKEIVRIEAIAIRNMREKARAGKKLPIGYRWADNTDAIVPDAAARACGALLHMLEDRLGMDHAAAVRSIFSTLGGKQLTTPKQFQRANQFRLAFLLGWPEVAPSELEGLALRTNPSILVRANGPMVIDKGVRTRVRNFLGTGFHTLAELAKHLDRSVRTVAKILRYKSIAKFIVKDTSGPVPRYTWVVPSPRPKPPLLSPLDAILTSGVVVEPGPSPPPDPSDSQTADQPRS
jgi:hypothetical protein